MDGQRLVLLRQAAEAIASVHKAGFIHRDICPRNFVVSRDGDSLKLIDFGLTVPATAPFMAPGNRTGTANYMAPEVVRRRATSTRLDVFSFGVTAYELCAFALPWPKGQGKEAMVHGTEAPDSVGPSSSKNQSAVGRGDHGLPGARSRGSPRNTR